MLLAAVITATLSFAATNIDDIFVLTLFFSQRNQRLRSWHIVAGQYLGFSALIVVSLLGFLGAGLVRQEWIGLLGIAPIAIGIHKLLKRNDDPENDVKEQRSLSGIFGVASVTFANGGDNIGIYTPLFASFNSARLVVTLCVFYILLALWCVVGYAITGHEVVGRLLKRYGHLLVPLVLVGLGVYIIIENGTLKLLGR